MDNTDNLGKELYEILVGLAKRLENMKNLLGDMETSYTKLQEMGDKLTNDFKEWNESLKKLNPSNCRRDEYGFYTNLNTLEVGTKFWVINGAWEGKIIENLSGEKCMYVAETGFSRALRPDDELVIKIYKDNKFKHNIDLSEYAEEDIPY